MRTARVQIIVGPSSTRWTEITILPLLWFTLHTMHCRRGHHFREATRQREKEAICIIQINQGSLWQLVQLVPATPIILSPSYLQLIIILFFILTSTSTLLPFVLAPKKKQKVNYMCSSQYKCNNFISNLCILMKTIKLVNYMQKLIEKICGILLKYQKK